MHAVAWQQGGSQEFDWPVSIEVLTVTCPRRRAAKNRLATDSGPGVEYRHGREDSLGQAAQCDRRSVFISYGRLTTVILFLVLGGRITFGGLALSPIWLLLPAALYLVLVVAHERITRTGQRCSRAAKFYERGLSRLENRWAGTGNGGERFLDASHPYSADLDIFGRGSLFELLCTARTRAGEDLLADWLRTPAIPTTIHARQVAVSELRRRVSIRKDLAIIAEELQCAAVSEDLAAWGGRAPSLNSGTARVVAAALTVIAIGGLITWAVGHTPYVAMAAVLLNWVFLLAYRKRLQTAVSAAESAVRDLGILAEVLGVIERQKLTAPRMVELDALLKTEGRLPSLHIQRLARLMELVDSRRNKLVRAFDSVVLWTFHSVAAVEAWRRDFGPAVRSWLSVVAEFEVLSALAGYAYEHPDDPFPEFVQEHPYCFAAPVDPAGNLDPETGSRSPIVSRAAPNQEVRRR